MLGNPGSGCSTFLKTIANQRQEYYSVDGSMHYDSVMPDELRQHFRGDVQYCPEDDVHFATLSVAQTIGFAARARTPRARVGETRKQFADKATDMLATLFGLRHALATPVGDAAIRGVSGGEVRGVLRQLRTSTAPTVPHPTTLLSSIIFLVALDTLHN